jgi:Leucine-rich repeat (LRR) protein
VSSRRIAECERSNAAFSFACRYNACMSENPTNLDSPESAKKHKRRWFQFSLRTLMIVTMICAIGSAWLGKKIERKRYEQEAVEAIVSSGGQVLYDYEMVKGGTPPGPAWLRKLLGKNLFSEVVLVNLIGRGQASDSGLVVLDRFPQLQELDLLNTKITDAGLVSLRGLNRLQELDLGETKVTDAGLVNLRGLTQLRRLDLAKTAITDAGLVNVKGLTQLRELELVDTKITDAGLVNLEGLHRLQLLSLTGTNVTDVGLAHLKRLIQLQSLNISDLKISDSGLIHLKGMTTLNELFLVRTKITGAGVRDLQKALPNCKINYWK